MENLLILIHDSFWRNQFSWLDSMSADVDRRIGDGLWAYYKYLLESHLSRPPSWSMYYYLLYLGCCPDSTLSLYDFHFVEFAGDLFKKIWISKQAKSKLLFYGFWVILGLKFGFLAKSNRRMVSSGPRKSCWRCFPQVSVLISTRVVECSLFFTFGGASKQN